MKNKKVLIASFIVLLLLLGLGFASYKAVGFAMSKYHLIRDELNEIKKNTENLSKPYNFDYSWMEGNMLVAHAFGGKGTKTYTNALEAFEYNYDFGHRVFEVDFDLTADGVTICCHDEDWWRYITGNEGLDTEYSYENFKTTPLFTDYTPLDYKDLVDLLIEYPDIYIITDTKYADEISVYKQFSQLTEYAKKTEPEVLNRIIPQFYNKEMLQYIMNVFPFNSVIFTLYQIQWEKEDIAKFCIKNGIRFITVSSSLADEETIKLWESMGIHVAVHTVNEDEEAKSFIKQGVEMIYTDFLDPKLYINEEE